MNGNEVQDEATKSDLVSVEGVMKMSAACCKDVALMITSSHRTDTSFVRKVLVMWSHIMLTVTSHDLLRSAACVRHDRPT